MRRRRGRRPPPEFPARVGRECREPRLAKLLLARLVDRAAYPCGLSVLNKPPGRGIHMPPEGCGMANARHWPGTQEGCPRLGHFQTLSDAGFTG
jgi:hypothetical protein